MLEVGWRGRECCEKGREEHGEEKVVQGLKGDDLETRGRGGFSLAGQLDSREKAGPGL
jgi:hypothetical protein